jgi:hypothetical protein
VRVSKTADRRIIYTWHHTRLKVLPPSLVAGLFHSISGRLRSAIWMTFPRAPTKTVFQEKQCLAVGEQLSLPSRLAVRCLLIARIILRRNEIPKQQSSLDRFAPILTALLKNRRKTRMQW